MRNRFGCLTGSGLIAALVTVLVIAAYTYARGGLLFNPGPLNAQSGNTLGGVTSHAEIDDCSTCHTAPWEAATMANRCVVCHTNIAEEMQNAASLHGRLLQGNPGLACRDCHSEHRGPNAQLTRIEGASFPHEVVGFSLNGHQLTAAGTPFACQDCHAGDVTTFDVSTCDTCHRQRELAFMTVHTLSFGSACLDCHDGVDRFDENFDHNVLPFKITGQHVGLACVQCHINARNVGDFAQLPTACAGCHSEPAFHAGMFGLDCAGCHTTDNWFATYNGPHPSIADEDEGGSGVNHGGASCRDCHTQTLHTATCIACHESNDPDDDEDEGENDGDDD